MRFAHIQVSISLPEPLAREIRSLNQEQRLDFLDRHGNRISAEVDDLLRELQRRVERAGYEVSAPLIAYTTRDR